MGYGPPPQSGDPYGQQPGQQPPNDPYGQQPPAEPPYGQQPPADPYAQQPPPADPYGQQPPADPYGQQGGAYGQQPPADPYAQQQQQYGAPPPGAAMQPSYGYADPGGAPYGIDPVTGLPWSDKTKLLAGLLNILVAGVGRMYAGHVGLGVAQLLVAIFTCGIGALWSLIDGIMILMNGGVDGQGRRLRDS